MKARVSILAAALGALAASAVPARAGDVTLTLANGRVSIVARNATPRQILEVWARQGRTRIVNLERVPGPPDSLILTNEPESKALAIVLRSAAGYIAAPRRVPMANASVYDRVLIMPTSIAAPAPAFRAAAAPVVPQQPAIFEVPPDPTTLANDEPGAAPAPVFQPGEQNAGVAGVPPQPPVSPYLPPPQGDGTGDAPQRPPTQPVPGQFTAGAPGVLPIPQPSQQQPPQQPR